MGINISYVETGASGSGASTHRVGVSYETDTSGASSGYHKFRYRFFIDVTGGNYQSSSFYASWSSSNITVSSSDTGYGSWSSWITVQSGQTSSTYTGTCGYINTGTSSSTYAKSTVSYTAPTLKWTVTYNANGGSGAPTSQTKYYGATLTLSSTIPTREGYSFVGWATSSTATSASYAAGGSYTSNAALTLYAVWSVSKACTIVYDANGGENAPLVQTHFYNSTSTLSSEKPTRYGYTFLGWATSSTATVVEYDSGGSYTNDDFEDGDAVTLYAVWKKIPSCEIVYDTNGGVGNMTSQTHVYGTTSIISDEKPTRDGFRFLGWSDKSYASKARYLVGGLYTNNDFTDGDIVTLYAVWRKIINVYIQIPKED